MKNFLFGLCGIALLCTIPIVSFGSDDAKTLKDPPVTLVADTQLYIVEPVIVLVEADVAPLSATTVFPVNETPGGFLPGAAILHVDPGRFVTVQAFTSKYTTFTLGAGNALNYSTSRSAITSNKTSPEKALIQLE